MHYVNEVHKKALLSQKDPLVLMEGSQDIKICHNYVHDQSHLYDDCKSECSEDRL